MRSAEQGALRVAAGAFVLLLAAACGSAQSDAEGTWVLVEGRGPEGPVVEVPGFAVTMTVAEGTVSGTAACNFYSSEARADATAFEVAELVVTEMACEPSEVMEAEAAYLAALADAETAERDGDQLSVTGPETELRFEAADEEDGA